MPITRSHQGSTSQSEGEPEAAVLTPAEIEMFNRRLIDKEKVLQE